MKLLIWNKDTIPKKFGTPDPAYIIEINSGSVLELQNEKGQTVFHIEASEGCNE